MADNKTRVTKSSVEGYLEAIDNETRRKDCQKLTKLMSRATGQKPVMWGSSIVGFGTYHYKYESGHEGDSCLAGFSSRKANISVYLMARFPGHEELLSRLGKHKMGKACLYIRCLSDVDLEVLGQLVTGSVAELKRRYSW